MIIIQHPDSFVRSFPPLPEQISTEGKEDATQRTLLCQNKKEILECTLLDREFSFSLKLYSSNESQLEIFYNEQTKKFHGVVTSREGCKTIVNSCDIEGIPKKLKQYTAEQILAFFDQVHARIARLSNGEYKVYLHVKGLGGAGPEDDFSYFLEALNSQHNNKESEIGILMDNECFTLEKGTSDTLKEAVDKKVIGTDFKQQIEKFFAIISTRQEAVKEAITSILLFSTHLNEYCTHLSILEARLKACQELYDKFGPIFARKIDALTESQKENDPSSLDTMLSEAADSSPATVQSLKTVIITQLENIGRAYKEKLKAFERLDVRKQLETEEPTLKNAILYEYFGEKLKTTESIQATEIHKKAIAEYEKYKDTLKDNKAQSWCKNVSVKLKRSLAKRKNPKMLNSL